MKIKRILAYLIDILIVSFASTLIFKLPVFSDDSKTYNNYMNDYTNILFSGGSSDIDQEQLDDIVYNISKSSSSLFIIRLGLLIFYFGILGYVWNGKTVGKKIFKLQIVPNEGKSLNPGLYFLREVLVTGFIFEVISLLLLMLASKSVYLNYGSYVSYASYFAYFILFGFIIFRDDERGLHDIICNTKVISTKEK